MLRIGIAATGLLMAAGVAQAQEPPEGLTWMALNEINGNYFNRAEPMNHPAFVREVPAGMITAVDVSPDGKPDWLVDYGKAEQSSWCGTGGCLTTLYVSHGDDYVMAFDNQALKVDIYDRDGERRVEAGVHHTGCVPDNWDCAYAFAWDADLGQLVQRPTAAGGTLLAPGLTPVAEWDESIDLRPNLPSDISAAWYGSRLVCPSTATDGFEARRAIARDVPDLNGDGRRDWILDAPYLCEDLTLEEQAPSPGFEVYLSDGDEMIASYRSEPGHWAAIDMSATPPRLIDNPSCGYGSDCPNRPLSWNGRTFAPD